MSRSSTNAVLVHTDGTAESLRPPEFAVAPRRVQDGDRVVCTDAGEFLRAALSAAEALGEVDTDPLFAAVDAGRVVDAGLLKSRLQYVGGTGGRLDPAGDPAAALAAAEDRDAEIGGAGAVLPGAAADARASLARAALAASPVQADQASVGRLLAAREEALAAAWGRLRRCDAARAAFPPDVLRGAVPDFAELPPNAEKKFFRAKLSEFSDHAGRPLSLPAPPGEKAPSAIAGWGPWAEVDPDLAAWFALHAAGALRATVGNPPPAAVVPLFGPTDAAGDDLPAVAHAGAGRLVRVTVGDLTQVAFAAVRAQRPPFEGEVPGDVTMTSVHLLGLIRAAAKDSPVTAPWRDRLDLTLAAAVGDGLACGLPEDTLARLDAARGGGIEDRERAVAFARRVLLGMGWDRRPADAEGKILSHHDPRVWDRPDDFDDHGLLADLWLHTPGFGRHLVADALAPFLAALGLPVDPDSPRKPSFGATLGEVFDRLGVRAGRDAVGHQRHLEKVLTERAAGTERVDILDTLAAAAGPEGAATVARWREKPKVAARVLKPFVRGAFGTAGGRVWHTAAGPSAVLITRGEILAAVACGLARGGCPPAALLTDGVLCAGDPRRAEDAATAAVVALFGDIPDGAEGLPDGVAIRAESAGPAAGR